MGPFISPHSVAWADHFAEESGRIRALLYDVELEVEHIGSTAVAGLLAKPIIVALASSADNIERVAEVLPGLGYIDRGTRGGQLFIRVRDSDIRPHNLHIYEKGDPDYRAHLAFRDALRSDPDVRRGYAQLKAEIVRRLVGNRSGYAEQKSDFIRSVVAAHDPS